MDDLTAITKSHGQQQDRKRILVVGAGISGLSAAWLLSKSHQVTLVEANGYFGGHSNTIDINIKGNTMPVDTGFIVFNPQNYPNLTALFEHLGVASAATDMSFSVSKGNGSFEYSGGDGGGLLAQPSNLLRLRFWRMALHILRFYKNSKKYASSTEFSEYTLGELLAKEKYSSEFYEDHLGPMGAAIWSSDSRSMLEYPVQDFLNFFNNHGLTQLTNRPQWRTVVGGSREYVKKLINDMAAQVHTRSAITEIRRSEEAWCAKTVSGVVHRAEHIVFACHSNEAAKLVAEVAPQQADILGKMRYGANSIVLHSDPSLMPHRKKAWASWNYIEHEHSLERPGVSYWMNKLQHLPTKTPVIATLNSPRKIKDEKVFAEFDYQHPIFDSAARRAREQLWSLQGASNLWYCGAYLGDGFHEDGIQAGLAIAEMLGGYTRPWDKPNQNARLGLGQSLLFREGAT